LDAAWSALVIDDDPGVRQSVRLCLEADSARVQGVGTSSGTLDALDRSAFDVVFLDLWLGADSGIALLPEILKKQPGVGVIVVTAHASFESAVEAMRLGAVDYLPKPFTPEQVRHAARRVVAERRLKREISELKERVGQAETDSTFATESATFRGFLESAARVAASDAVVLLTGESGTGKSVFARWLWQKSKRADRPFVTVHCPLLSTELMASALFGHVKGAFTGATGDVRGKVEEAEGGTLFLDEVGDLSSEAQARLLRFINDRTYERLGEAKDRQADVRIIAATNRSLDDEVRRGRFREDLLFRLNVVKLALLPLRERREDVISIARHFLAFFGSRQNRAGLSFSPATEESLTAYSWPGNLRELKNAVERAVILGPGPLVEPRDLGLSDAREVSSGAALRSSVGLGEEVSLEVIEREHIARVVARSRTLEAAAKTLEIDATTLQRKRKKYGLA
jgi:NtrC-family two-component system response regulator AlgB